MISIDQSLPARSFVVVSLGDGRTKLRSPCKTATAGELTDYRERIARAYDRVPDKTAKLADFARRLRSAIEGIDSLDKLHWSEARTAVEPITGTTVDMPAVVLEQALRVLKKVERGTLPADLIFTVAAFALYVIERPERFANSRVKQRSFLRNVFALFLSDHIGEGNKFAPSVEATHMDARSVDQACVWLAIIAGDFADELVTEARAQPRAT
jgi:hypothetical protein